MVFKDILLCSILAIVDFCIDINKFLANLFLKLLGIYRYRSRIRGLLFEMKFKYQVGRQGFWIEGSMGDLLCRQDGGRIGFCRVKASNG